MGIGISKRAVVVAAIGVALAGCSSSSPTRPAAGALLSGVERVVNSAGTVHCRGVWNYTNPQNHPSIDVHITIGPGTWSMTSEGGITVAKGTFKMSGSTLTARVASVHETVTKWASEMPWVAKGSTLVVSGLPSGPQAPTALAAIATYRTSAAGETAVTNISLKVHSVNGTTEILAEDPQSVGQTITCAKQ